MLLLYVTLPCTLLLLLLVLVLMLLLEVGVVMSFGEQAA